jgi:hypothetical protein
MPARFLAFFSPFFTLELALPREQRARVPTYRAAVMDFGRNSKITKRVFK